MRRSREVNVPNNGFFRGKKRKDFVRIKEGKRDVEKFENTVLEISPAHSLIDLYEERIAPPEIFTPAREYIQKDEDTPLPPENLQMFWRELSFAAREAWLAWVGEGFECPYKKVKLQLIGSLEDAFFTKEEKETLTRYRRIVAVEDGRWKQEQEAKLHATIKETPRFQETQIGIIERYKYSPNISELLDQYNRTTHETEKWRKPYLSQSADLIPNCGMRDDPDFIPPSSQNSSFCIIIPASRVFNAIFSVYLYVDKPPIPLYPQKGCSTKKDYTDVNDVIYLFKEKGITPYKVVIDHCKFEYDLRVTYASAPDPKNYKKVDPKSTAGLKLMKWLNEQPYMWKEFCWQYESGESRTEKKVAYGLTFITEKGPATYWVYLDEDYVRGNNILSSRKKPVNVSFLTQKDYEGKEVPLLAEITYHVSQRNGFCRDSSGGLLMKDIVQVKTQCLEDKGYIFVKRSEDLCDNITELFIRRDACSKKQRDKLLLSPTDYHTKHGDS